MSERVCVMVRFRPESKYQQQQSYSSNKDSGQSTVTSITPDNTECAMQGLNSYGATKTFTFDRIFSSDCGQSEVFEAVGRPLVEAALQGYNGTVLAYGQTGSGKTHTMMGPEGGAADLLASPNNGLVPRVLSVLFEKLQKLPEGEVVWSVHASMFELWNENLYDLSVNGSANPEKLIIREDRATGRGVYVEGLNTVPITTPEQFLTFVQTCSRNKHVARTNSNETSSRSHTLVQVTVVQQNNVYGGTKTSANIFLVDLAGSERVEKTGAEGLRLKESQSINLSLTLLGNVINKLTDSHALHIPYRDSKLTRILQDSLGGNSRTTLLCMCSPMVVNHAETMSTLAFATRAKSIQNKPRVNKELSGDELRKAYLAALDEIRILTERTHLLEGTKDAVQVGTLRKQKESTAMGGSSEDVDALLREIEQYKTEIHQLQTESAKFEDRVTFYKKREEELTAKQQEMKTKYDREKLAADSWMRKFQELEQKKAPPPPAPGKGITAAGSAKKLRKPSVDRSSNSNTTNITPTTVAEQPSQGLPLTPTSTPTGPSEIEILEIRFAVREKNYLQQIEELESKKTEWLRDRVVLERVTKERDSDQKKFNEEMEATIAKYETMLSKQDKEIGDLQMKLDTRVNDTQQRQFAMVGDMERLQRENDILHEENRANATRLLDFAKRLEKQAREIETLHNERVRLMKEVEDSSLSAEAKAKILGGKIRAEQKSYFQRKLLECFRTEEN